MDPRQRIYRLFLDRGAQHFSYLNLRSNNKYMPTAYSNLIQEGATFQEYALACARNFGALVEMRDDPMDAPIPDSFPVSSYGQECLARALEEKEKYDFYTNEDWIAQFQEYKKKQFEYAEKTILQKLETREKYEKMLEKVRKYVPPTEDHVNYAQFLESQIVESIEWDCRMDYYEDLILELKFQHWREYKEEMIEGNLGDIERAEKYLEGDKDRGEDRSDWIRQLKESVAKVD